MIAVKVTFEYTWDYTRDEIIDILVRGGKAEPADLAEASEEDIATLLARAMRDDFEIRDSMCEADTAESSWQDLDWDVGLK